MNASRWHDHVTQRMHQNSPVLQAQQTVADALAWLRRHALPGRIVYFYVVDEAGVLCGVVPTRRLVLSEPDRVIADIMGREVMTVPARATILEVCELFIRHQLLAFPVVDDAGRFIGVVDVELYAEELARFRERVPVAHWIRPIVRFMHIESSSGIVLLACTVLALILANSPWSAEFISFWEVPVGLTWGDRALTLPLLLWINDGLMTLFFFVVGLEIKRELVLGELRDWRQAMLPAVAALGGMVAPACVYLTLQWGQPTVNGWGIPMATDIAFVVGFLTLFGSRVPYALKLLLLSLAIADDLGAILVIALAYSDHLAVGPLAMGLAGFVVVLLLRWIGVRRMLVYVVVAAGIWVAFLKSGVHPTIMGAILGFLTPARAWLGDRVPLDVATDLLRRTAGFASENGARRDSEPVSPLEYLLTELHPWVAFLIMPLFALANAGVAIDLQRLGQPVAIAVALGLIIGKPIGIVSFSWAAIQIGLARRSAQITVPIFIGAGCLGGIGFTMSLFVASLAFTGPSLDAAKVGILTGSTVSAILGCLILWRFLPAAPK